MGRAKNNSSAVATAADFDSVLGSRRGNPDQDDVELRDAVQNGSPNQVAQLLREEPRRLQTPAGQDAAARIVATVLTNAAEEDDVRFRELLESLGLKPTLSQQQLVDRTGAKDILHIVPDADLLLEDNAFPVGVIKTRARCRKKISNSKGVMSLLRPNIGVFQNPSAATDFNELTVCPGCAQHADEYPETQLLPDTPVLSPSETNELHEQASTAGLDVFLMWAQQRTATQPVTWDETVRQAAWQVRQDEAIERFYANDTGVERVVGRNLYGRANKYLATYNPQSTLPGNIRSVVSRDSLSRAVTNRAPSDDLFRLILHSVQDNPEIEAAWMQNYGSST